MRYIFWIIIVSICLMEYSMLKDIREIKVMVNEVICTALEMEE